MTASTYKHWRLEHDLDEVAWLTLDRADENTNSLSREVLSELESVVTTLENDKPRGLVLQSGKPGSFIVGADVREFDDATDHSESADAIRQVHQLFNRIEALPFPTAVTIDGYCLGGGLELALCFDYRIAKNTPNTRLGFPEVRLGIYPGFGGSARSVQRIGGQKAMEIMLTGRMLRSGAARGMGLVDQLVPAHGELRWAARKAILKNKKSRSPGRIAKLTNIGPARRALAKIMRKQTAAKANPKHYPAPFELIDAWEEYGDDPHRMMAEEAIRVGRLITEDTSRNLRRVFKLMERLKGLAKGSDFKARRVHVIGAGVMGGDIAAWCVLQGLEVTLQDREMKYIEPALKRAKSLFRKKLKKSNLVAGAVSRLIPDVDAQGVRRADVIIEAIFENADAKRDLFKKLEADIQPHTVIATNTSAIPLDEIASVLKQPNRLIGLHFFNPVAKMPLVEVVYGEKTDKKAIADGTSFCGQINRFPLPVKSSPGFLVNRVLAPYMLKAFKLHREQNIPKEALDKAAVNFGMPMGPVELADTVGLDVGLHVIGTLGGADAEPEREVLKSYVDKGKLGKKSGEGFYVWEKGIPRKKPDAADNHNLESLAKDLMSPYFDECEACLADGIIEDEDIVDAGMIFGTGFAPFRGGPMHYLKSLVIAQESAPTAKETKPVEDTKDESEAASDE